MFKSVSYILYLKTAASAGVVQIVAYARDQ